MCMYKTIFNPFFLSAQPLAGCSRSVVGLWLGEKRALAVVNATDAMVFLDLDCVFLCTLLCTLAMRVWGFRKICTCVKFLLGFQGKASSLGGCVSHVGSHIDISVDVDRWPLCVFARFSGIGRRILCITRHRCQFYQRGKFGKRRWNWGVGEYFH